MNLMTEIRSAAAQAGHCDEPKLVHDMLAALIGCETITECVRVWSRYAEPVEHSISPETLAQLGRALRIRIAVISPPV